MPESCFGTWSISILQTAAAICAATLGAKVLLVEATGCLGGMGTSGMVSQWSNLSNPPHSPKQETDPSIDDT